MKKLLIVSQGFEPEFFPINLFAKNLPKNYKVDILTGKPNYPKGKIYPGYSAFSLTKEIKKKYTIYRVPIFPRGTNSNLRILLNYFSFIISGIILGSYLLKGKKYDYIFVYATSPIFQSFIAIFFKIIKKKVKLILWVQDLWPEVLKDTGVIKNKILLKILDKIINKIYVCFDLIFVQSESFKNYINKKKISNCKILHNPGYNFFFKIKKKVSKKINILYAGNIGKAQPVEFICKLVNNLPKNYFFNIAGSGKDYSKLYNKLNFKNKNFELLGNLSFKKLRYFYNQSDALFLFLKNNKNLNKTIPSKFQSYLSVGKPILASIGGDTKNIIKVNRIGYVSKPCNVNDTLKIFRNFSNVSKIGRIKMGILCKKYYKKKFHITNIINSFIKEIEKL